MGIPCSTIEKEDGDHVGEARDSDLKQTHSKLVKKLPHPSHTWPQADGRHSDNTMDRPYDTVDALDSIINLKIRSSSPRRKTILDQRHKDKSAAAFRDVSDYMSQREMIVSRESTIAFDHRCTAGATDLEKRVNEIIQVIKHNDKLQVYDAAAPRKGYGGQLHPRFPGDHFLSNQDLIEKTDLFRITRRMPKGAHLHIHFNACLLPHVLLDIAKGMDRMFITSDLPLIPDNDFVNYFRSEIQFSILAKGKENSGDIFSADYQPRQTMSFREFIDEFPRRFDRCSVDAWLIEKLVFQEDEANGLLQTAVGAWEKFNGRTRMMKGLFNYETAYRKYTRLLLEDFMEDNIQYAEIRPNFMKNNQLWSDDGVRQIDNVGIMEIIMAEYDKFQAETKRYFGGLKVIYCTPRSFSNELVKYSLDECIAFKKRWPEWIAGYDLVGEESKGYPLKQFIPEFINFRKKCESERVEIPFLFHCGETLDIGADTDGNLVDALLLGSKRIGHGFALARHPYVMEHMKKRGVCLEVCPISNEILGLTPRVTGHAMYNLLANNVHCTIASDNGTLFRSTLSDDFYQVMVGKADMTLYGWRQLIEWSLQHSCMSDIQYKIVYAHWEQAWEDFLRWVEGNYGAVEKILPVNGQ